MNKNDEPCDRNHITAMKNSVELFLKMLEQEYDSDCWNMCKQELLWRLADYDNLKATP